MSEHWQNQTTSQEFLPMAQSQQTNLEEHGGLDSSSDNCELLYVTVYL